MFQVMSPDATPDAAIEPGLGGVEFDPMPIFQPPSARSSCNGKKSQFWAPWGKAPWAYATGVPRGQKVTTPTRTMTIPIVRSESPARPRVLSILAIP